MQRPIKSSNQSNQENFVIFCSGFKYHGNYLEIGASDGVSINNTFVLERFFGWGGVGVEIDSILCDLYNDNRTNVCISADATTLNYKNLMDKHNLPKYIEYLQVDIEPANQSLQALIQVLGSDRRFGFITFEHDLYRDSANEKVKNDAQVLLLKSGYKKVYDNIKYDGSPFEDWYVDPSKVSLVRLYVYKILTFFKLINITVLLGQYCFRKRPKW